jgi:hypothetical protein
VCGWAGDTPASSRREHSRPECSLHAPQPESVTVRAKRSEQAGLGGGRLGANGDGVGVLATAE